MPFCSPPRRKRRRHALSLCLLGLLGPSSAQASEPEGPVSPSEVSGQIRRAREPGEGLRDVLHAALFLPRSVLEILFSTTGEAAGVIEEEQFVPRARALLSPREGKIVVFPTFFLETGMNPNVGARMIGNFGTFATSLRAGYGGRDNLVAEARMRLGIRAPIPSAFFFEALHDERAKLGYLGMGQHPFEDLRNHYLGEEGAGLFREKRDRVILGYGLRPQNDAEVFLSTSLLQRRTDDARESDERALSRVFAPESLSGAFGTMRISYTELAYRYDSRESRQAMATGGLFEAYGGMAQQISRGDSQFLRGGARGAGFFSIYRPTNILSPRIALDGLLPTGGSEIPFRELIGQPSFRGTDSRRDKVSLVLSLDYRWQLARYIAARLFVDGATVAPSLLEIDWTSFRPAWGFGIDLHSSDAELGRIALAMSPEGASFLFVFGAPAGFGDRQHRD